MGLHQVTRISAFARSLKTRIGCFSSRAEWQIAQQRRLVLPCQDRILIQRFAKIVPSLPWPAQTDGSVELWPSRLQTSNSWEYLLLSMHQQAHQRPPDSRSPRKELRP